MSLKRAQSAKILAFRAGWYNERTECEKAGASIGQDRPDALPFAMENIR